MGMISMAAEFLVQAKAAGTSFGRTLTLGRQSMFVSPVQVARLMKRYRCFPANLADAEFYRQQFSSPYVADSFLRALGATEVLAMDASATEAADIVHDLNLPVPDNLKESFDTVIDGGTLEHVFNFPVAIKSCMEMTKVGGTIFIITPANNQFGHGFYQFSAELFYRIFSSDNGFRVDRVHAAESEIFGSKLLGRSIAIDYCGRVYSVRDPAQVKDRVLLATRLPVYMIVQATRVARSEILAHPPQQSDYEAAWNAAAGRPAPPQITYTDRWPTLKNLQLYWLPKICRLNPFLIRRNLRRRSFSNRQSFERLKRGGG